MKHKFLFIIAALVLMTACGSGEDSPVTMVSHTYTLHTQDTLNPLTVLYMNFKVEWPCREDSAIEAIRRDVTARLFGVDAVDRTIEEAMLLYSDTLRRQYREEFAIDESVDPEEGDYGKIYHDMVLSIDDPCECFLNFEMYEEESNSFAPHGTHETYYYCYDRRSGEWITEDKLFQGDYQPVLTKLITEAIWRSYRSRGAVGSLEQIGLDVEQAEPNGNFYISEDCITYFYQENEIGCYAAGPQTAVVQLEDMRAYLRDTTIIHHHE